MLKFHPKTGTILIMNFNEMNPQHPEIIKERPVIVISPRLRRKSGLCTIVPLSTTAPDPVENHHCEIIIKTPLPSPWNSGNMWVKADMIYTVSYKRLNLIRTKRNQYGKRKYLTPILEKEQLARVKQCVTLALGLS